MRRQEAGAAAVMTTMNTEQMSAREFQERLTAAAPGETIVYAVGFLVIDIHQAFLAKGPNAAELNKLAGLALTASNRGDVFLTQRRVGLGRFEYRSTKSLTE